jgi:hypothetical protein
MSVENSIYRALVTRLSTFTVTAPLTGAVPILYQGSGGTPPAASAAMWIECRLFPAEPDRASLNGPIAQRRGYMQALCLTRYRANALDQLSMLADQVAGHFPQAERYRHGGVEVQIATPPGLQSMFEDEGKLQIPVIIRYRALA